MTLQIKDTPRHGARLGKPCVINVIPDDGGGGAQKIARQITDLLEDQYDTNYFVLFDPTNHVNGRMAKFGRWAGALRRLLREIINRRSRDILLISHLDGALIATFVVKFLLRNRVRRIHVFHGPPAGIASPSRLTRSLYRAALSRADRLIFVSVAQAHQHAAVFPPIAALSSVITNPLVGYDQSKKTENLAHVLNERAVPVLLLPGRLSIQKNQIFAIHLLRYMHDVGSMCRLLLAGDGDQAPQLQEMCDRLNLKWSTNFDLRSEVTFLGHVEGIREIMAKSDCTLFPSLAEGFPLAHIEAAHAGSRVIASDCPTGPAEIKERLASLNDAGICFELLPSANIPDDLPIWHKAIEAILKRDCEFTEETARQIEFAFSEDRFSNEWRDCVAATLA